MSPRMRIARPGPGKDGARSLLGDPERTADAAHLVLEEQAQRFDDPEVHLLGQPADVVVRLDRRRGPLPTPTRSRRDRSSLRQPAHVLDPDRLVVEYLTKSRPMILRWSRDRSRRPGHPGTCRRPSRPDVQAHVLIRLEHVLEFVLAQQARIHEDAVEFLPMALCSSTAATDESTPPESPSTTLSSPSFSCNSRTVASRNSPRSTPACSRRYPRRNSSAGACRRSNGKPVNRCQVCSPSMQERSHAHLSVLATTL